MGAKHADYVVRIEWRPMDRSRRWSIQNPTGDLDAYDWTDVHVTATSERTAKRMAEKFIIEKGLQHGRSYITGCRVITGK